MKTDINLDLLTKGLALYIAGVFGAALILMVEPERFTRFYKIARKVKVEGRLLLAIAFGTTWPIYSTWFVLRALVRGVAQLVTIKKTPPQVPPAKAKERL